MTHAPSREGGEARVCCHDPGPSPARLQSLAGAPGRAVHPFVHRSGLCVQRLQPAADPPAGDQQVGPGDWQLADVGWIFSIAIVVLGASAAAVRALGRGRGSAACHVHGRPVLWPGLRRVRRRHQSAPAVAGVPGLRRVGGHGARTGLHLAGVDADQVVSGPSGHGHRHGHHGFRRWCLHRLAAVGVADAEVLNARCTWASPRPSWCWAAATSSS